MMNELKHAIVSALLQASAENEKRAEKKGPLCARYAANAAEKRDLAAKLESVREDHPAFQQSAGTSVLEHWKKTGNVVHFNTSLLIENLLK